MVHPASGLTILINATGQEELINTILRAELAAIHQALIEFRDISTFKFLTDSLTSLRQLQTVLTCVTSRSELYYPHHDLRHAIMEEIVARDTKGFATQIRNVIAHVVRGNELVDAAAKSVITNTDHGHQSKVLLSLTLGAVPQRPEFCLEYCVQGEPCPRPCGNVHGVGIGLAAFLLGAQTP